MKNIFAYFLLGATVLTTACGEGNIQIIPDPTVQRNEDIKIIEDFFVDQGFSLDEVDTTEAGVRYIIIEAGQTQFSSTSIDESDIVSFNYIGRLTTDTLFDTSIQSIAEGTSIFSESRVYEPFVINYTASGWTIQGRFVNGFSDGITNTFGKMGIGGHALVAMPSALGYGGSPPFGSNIPTHAVLTFDLFPVKVRKQ